MSIEWACGVTAVASRLRDGTLDRTLASLERGGFTDLRLFVDGIKFPIGWNSEYKDLPITCHDPALKIQGNFHLALSELFLRQPHADRYAIFQDDLVTYKNLRQYLEELPYPKDGYLNLYTFAQNEKPLNGWYPSNQLGKSAVALVFDNLAVRTLLTSEHWILRHWREARNPDRKWKFIDGGIVEAFRQAGFKEYVHNPSLVQHTGTKSTLGNSRHALANTFRGEDFDAMDLLSEKPLPSLGRIGLVGYNAKEVGGEIYSKIAEHADIYRWLVKPHPKWGMVPLSEFVDTIVCPIGDKIDLFLKQVDIVLYIGAPCYEDLLRKATLAQKDVVCIEPEKLFIPTTDEGWKEFSVNIRRSLS